MRSDKCGDYFESRSAISKNAGRAIPVGGFSGRCRFPPSFSPRRERAARVESLDAVAGGVFDQGDEPRELRAVLLAFTPQATRK
jgi:hypothetical protein